MPNPIPKEKLSTGNVLAWVGFLAGLFLLILSGVALALALTNLREWLETSWGITFPTPLPVPFWWAMLLMLTSLADGRAAGWWRRCCDKAPKAAVFRLDCASSRRNFVAQDISRLRDTAGAGFGAGDARCRPTNKAWGPVVSTVREGTWDKGK